MLNRFRRHFGTAGLLVAVVALIAALTGGAIAAQGGGDRVASASKKHKKKAKVKRGPRGPRGKRGPAGSAGPAGANGKDGAPGVGTPGNNGANGKTVLNGTATPNAGIGTLGDFYIDTDDSLIYGPKAAAGANGGWGTGTDLKGADGADSPFAGGTLAPNTTETGAWQITLDGSGNGFATLSFPIPLATAITGAANLHVIRLEDPVPLACEGDDANPDASAANPEADSGHFCLFESSVFNPGGTTALPAATGIFPPGAAFPPSAATSTSGALLSVQGGAAGVPVTGTWAVTG